MVHAEPLSLLPAQLARLARFHVEQSVDIHCHCLPGLDDGPQDMAEAIDLCRALAADGITTVIATPHQLGQYQGTNHPDEVRRVAKILRAELRKYEVPLVVEVGADVRLDERMADLIARGQVLTLADGMRFLLLELPHTTLIDPRRLVSQLEAQGLGAILSHPERQAQIARNPDLIAAWVESGIAMQVTAASITGDFGEDAHRAAWHLLKRGWVSLVATDAHSINSRPPQMSSAIDLIAAELGHGVARRLCIENPARVLRGEDFPGQRPLSTRSNVGSGH